MDSGEEVVTGFRARVVDAGGGEVRLLVERETAEYPAVGQWVSVTHWSETVRRPNPRIVSDPWWGTPFCVVCGGWFYDRADMVSARGWRLWKIWVNRYRHEGCTLRRRGKDPSGHSGSSGGEVPRG